MTVAAALAPTLAAYVAAHGPAADGQRLYALLLDDLGPSGRWNRGLLKATVRAYELGIARAPLAGWPSIQHLIASEAGASMASEAVAAWRHALVVPGPPPAPVPEHHTAPRRRRTGAIAAAVGIAAVSIGGLVTAAGARDGTTSVAPSTFASDPTFVSAPRVDTAPTPSLPPGVAETTSDAPTASPRRVLRDVLPQFNLDLCDQLTPPSGSGAAFELGLMCRFDLLGDGTWVGLPADLSSYPSETPPVATAFAHLYVWSPEALTAEWNYWSSDVVTDWEHWADSDAAEHELTSDGVRFARMLRVSVNADGGAGMPGRVWKYDAQPVTALAWLTDGNVDGGDAIIEDFVLTFTEAAE